MCHNFKKLWSRTLSSKGSCGCETTKMSIGLNQLLAEAVLTHVFTEQEEAILLGEFYENWRHAGDSSLIDEAESK